MSDSGIAYLCRQRFRKATRCYCFRMLVLRHSLDAARAAMKQATDRDVIEYLHENDPGFPLLRGFALREIRRV